MATLERLLTPTYQKRGDGSARNEAQRDRKAAVTTYRYLRFGMVGIVVALAASLVVQRAQAGCWQGSISAYYHTPAGPLFVSAMFAIGVALIVIKGSTVLEDLLLNFAGVLAPIVAFVPTAYEAPCTPGRALVDEASVPVSDAIQAEVQNNLTALMVAGTFALAFGVLVFALEARRAKRRSAHAKLDGRWMKPQVSLLGVTALMVLAGWILLATGEILDLHGKAASLMFVFLAFASIWSGVALWKSDDGERPRAWRGYARAYVGIGGAMAVIGIVLGVRILDFGDQHLLVLEVLEIGLFAAMWVVQSIERWGSVVDVDPA